VRLNFKENIEDTQAGSVIPLQYLRLSDTDISGISGDEQMKSVLANMEEHEGGYAVRHSNQPVSEFGCGKGKYGTLLLNPIAAAYPTLFPYGVGGFEVPRKQTISFDEEVHCALQYHNGRFRTHHSFAFVVFSIEQKRQALRSA